ncbi:intraflagellar transport protein 74 homolog [Symsagittifera roscoffensis]|uniref:intraflagellar transport protein 74 homolog n=1 Tax=Symsagittifera roscoffensis TaxID=84072 RepID=UPI00307C0DA0
MERPRTRIGSAIGQRPGSSMRVAGGPRAPNMQPPPSSMGRQGGVFASGGSGKTGITDRPVTKQGVANPNKLKTGYANRNVKDSGYHKYSINAKCNEIEAKTNEFQQKTEKIYRDMEQFGPMVEKAEKTAKELADLQTQFRSINLTKELKQRGELNEGAIAEDIERCKEDNSSKRRDIEDLMQRKEKIEKRTRQILEKIEHEEQVREQSLKSALPREEYERVLEKQKELKDISETIPQEKEKLSQKNLQVEDKLKRLKSQHPEKFYAYSLLMRIKEMAIERQRLHDKNNKFDQEAEQNRLMDEIQTKKQRIEELRGRLNYLVGENRSLNDRLNSYETDSHLQPDQMEKLRKLNAKQAEMKHFKESFPELKREEIEKIQNIQDVNENLIQQMASKREMMKSVPSHEKFGEMQNTLEFKQSEMEKAESTHSAVAAQKYQLVNDLHKMEQLLPRILSEAGELQNQLKSLNEEKMLYGDIKGLENREKELKIALSAEKESLQKRMDWVKKDVTYLEKSRDDLKSALSANETYSQLKALEQRWVAEEQRNATLADFIGEKEAKIDCAPVRAEGLKKMKDINQILLAQLKTPY